MIGSIITYLQGKQQNLRVGRDNAPAPGGLDVSGSVHGAIDAFGIPWMCLYLFIVAALQSLRHAPFRSVLTPPFPCAWNPVASNHPRTCACTQPGALQAAVDAAAASATAATTTLSLAPGIHSLDHTLSLNGSHAGLVITGGAAAAADARAQGDVPDSAVISGGVAIDQGWSLSLVQAPMVMEVEPEAGRGSATTPPAPVHIWRTPLNEARYPLKVRAGSFRTVRYGAELAIPARCVL